MKVNNDWLVKFIAQVIVFLIMIVAIMGIIWLIWLLWTWVLPQIWPTGPQSLINPGYWLFIAAWFLASIVFRMIIGRGKS